MHNQTSVIVTLLLVTLAIIAAAIVMHIIDVREARANLMTPGEQQRAKANRLQANSNKVRHSLKHKALLAIHANPPRANDAFSFTASMRNGRNNPARIS